MRMRHGVRADSEATIGMLPQLVPAHRRKLSRIVAGQLGDAQGSTRARVPSTDEDLDAHTEPLERREDGRRAPKRVVESRVHLPEARQRTNLPHQEIRPNAKSVLPGRRDSVVAEDERPTSAGRHRPQIIQPMKIPKARVAANITTLPKLSGT